MKLKLTLRRGGDQSTDVLATVDSRTTIGDLATFLWRADPVRKASSNPADGRADTPPPDVTIFDADNARAVYDPSVPVGESQLRSGSVVSLGPSGKQFSSPDAGASAILTVVDGPDRGRDFNIRDGASIIGRERGCDVRLKDPLVSRQHARINVTDVVEIVDLGSANGLLLGDSTVTRTILRPGEVVQIGETSFTIRQLHRVENAAGERTSAVGFIRSPRLAGQFSGVTFEAPDIPERQKPQRFPVAMLIAPVMMGGILYLVTKQVTSLIFVALMPMMMIGATIEQRLASRADYKKALKQYREDLADLEKEVSATRDVEKQTRLSEHPATAECVTAIRNATPLLWTRRPADPGFLELRLAVGTQPSRSKVELPDARRAPRALFKELREQFAPYAQVDGVPVVGMLGAESLGIAGSRQPMLGVARAAVLQLAALHSPAELIIAAIAAPRSAPDWEWLKWLPHTSSVHSPVDSRLMAANVASAGALLNELEELLQTRSRAHDKSDRVGPLPAIVLLVEHDAPADQARLVALAETGADHGIHVVWLASDVAMLPAACRTFCAVATDPESGLVGYVKTADAVHPVTMESLDAASALTYARTMSPVVDIGALVNDDSDLPRAVSLFVPTLNGPELTTSAESVIERWQESQSVISGRFAPELTHGRAGTLRAVVGQSATGPHAIDLRADGPHALVGGTTGAGKSELLQSWILAMAAAHSPDRVNFLLVDYKGGSAFSACNDLPHTVGLVTDLNTNGVRRALTSLRAELTRREHILNEHQAKDLMELEKKSPRDAPPSLIIVVDEFAALVMEVPEFVDGVIDVAQRGRSLGLHLILATQKPSGVIKGSLRANTNLRIALRVAESDDSADVIGSPDAAYFDVAAPGRAIARTGPGRLLPFQTGYAGGWTSDKPAPPEIHVEELTFGSGADWEPEIQAAGPPPDPDRNDLNQTVRSIRAAFELAEINEPRRPWLPDLGEVCSLATLPTPRRDDQLVFARSDDPKSQTQPTVAFAPDLHGNLIVYGAGGSGKSTLLRSLAIAAGFTVRGGPCHVYGIDFGARGLAMLEPLPHVGSIINGSDHERIVRLLQWLRALIDERAARYASVPAGSITEYRQRTGDASEPRIMVLIDGIAAFRQAYEPFGRTKWFDAFVNIAADGRSVGVNIVIAAEQRSGLTPALASAIQSRIVLRMPTADDYSMLNAPMDVLTPKSPPGRAIMDGREIQVAILTRDLQVDSQGAVAGDGASLSDQAMAIREFADAMQRAGIAAAPEIQSMPETVALAVLPLSEAPVIGVGSDLAPLSITPRGTFIVTGPPSSGRTTALQTIALACDRWRSTTSLYYFGSARSAVSKLGVWADTYTSAERALVGAGEITASLAERADDETVVVVIESINDFVNGPADFAMQDMMNALITNDHFVIAEGEASSLMMSMGLLGVAKTSRTGVALQPDQGDGSSVFRTDFPRLNRAEYPPGRCLYVRLGRTEVAQIAIP